MTSFLKSKPFLDAALLSAAFWCALLLLRPFADIPLNDDWQYAYSVRHILEGGGMRLSDMSSPTVVVQAFWGAFVCRLLGYGYGALRFSTMLLAWAGVLSFHRLLRGAGLGRGVAAASALLLAFNPLFFILTSSFMTDVNFLSLALAALWVSRLGLEKAPPDAKRLVLGSCLAALAYGVRQTGLAIPTGLTAWLFWRRKASLKNLCAVWLIPLCALSAHEIWYFKVHGPTVPYYTIMLPSLRHDLRRPLLALAWAAERSATALLYAGLFLAPFSAGFWLGRPVRGLRELSGSVVLLIGGASLAVLIAIVLGGGLPAARPYFLPCNYLGYSGLGCFGIDGAGAREGWMSGPWFWRGLDVLALVSLASAGLAFAVRGGGDPRARKTAFFLAFPCALMFLATLSSLDFFDRYILPLVPAALALGAAAQEPGRRAQAALWTGVLVFGVFSWAGAFDYLRASETAWSLGEQGVRLGMPAEKVKAGLDWCWSHEYQGGMDELKKTVRPEEIGEVELDCIKNPAAFVSFRSGFKTPRAELAAASYFSPILLREEILHLYSAEGGT